MVNEQTLLLRNTFKYIYQAGWYDFVEPDKSNTFQKAVKYITIPAYVFVSIMFCCLGTYTLMTNSYQSDFLTFLDHINFFIPTILFFTKFCFLLYNVKNVYMLIKIIHYDYLSCSQLILENSLELYKRYTDKVNMLTTMWNACVKLNTITWIIKPLIFLVYDRVTGNNENYYPKIFSITYPFTINDYTYPVVFIYEIFTIWLIAIYVVFQDVIVVLLITMMCYHFDIVQSALNSIKHTKDSDINDIIALNDNRLLNEKLIVCVKSHQELLR